MEKKHSLRTYVLTRFFFFILIVSAIEYVFGGLINGIIIPAIINTTKQDLGIHINGSDGLFSIAFVLAATWVMNKILPIFKVSPVAINALLERLALKNGFNGNDLEAAREVLTAFSEDPKLKVKLVLAVLVIAVVLMLPYIVGGIIFSVSVAREIRIREKEKEDARIKEEKRRYLMISNIVHDLKTPMTTVHGYAQALNDGVVPKEKQPEYLQAIMAKSDRMNDVVVMLLDYVKLDSEGFTIKPEKIDVCELVRSCCAFSYTDIETAGDEIEIDIPERVININADSKQLTRVVTNLITNAIRHTDTGTTIKVSVTSESETNAMDVKIIVADTDKAIEEKLAEQIFEPFFTSDESRATSSGTGLGLPLSRRICEMHGYTLKLVQKPELLRYQLGEEYQKAFVITTD